VTRLRKLKVGDPLDPETDIGTMIDAKAVQNTMAMIDEAVAQGATVLAGGKAKGSSLQPTLLGNVRPDMGVCSREVFAPLAVLLKYRDFKAVIDEVNNSSYGLQAGIFTNRLKDAFYAFKYTEVGGVVINDIPTFRADHQPYGGVKDSGLGREGIRYTIEDMTELKILSLNLK
jgi:acyl-CoA reductase-like NAD-dependent aldehyde dehydrogenase